MSGVHQTRDLIIERLRQGHASSGELSALTGRNKAAVNQSIVKLRARGYEIANLHKPGRHAEGLYELRGEPGKRRPRQCAEPGCITLLSADNASDKCRRHLVAAAWRAHFDFIDDLIGLIDEDVQRPAGVSR